MFTILLFFFVFIIVIDIALSICLFICPPGKLQKFIFYFLSLFIVISALIDFISQATNNIGGKVSAALPLIMILPALILYTRGQQVLLMKILVALAGIVNILSLIFISFL